MIKTLLTVLALIAVVVVAATDLDNGRYSLVHLKAAQFAEHRFDLDLPRFHKNQVHIVAVPHGCDSPINIFASVDKLPTNTTFDFSSKTVNVQRTSWLAANLTQSGHTHGERINMLIQAPVNPGQACSVYFNAYASHTQALQVLENSVPQWGVFHIDAQHQHPHIHWFEFDLKKHGDDKVEGLGFYITSLNGDLKQEHYTFNAFVSGDNARPTPQNHQWASLSLDDGEAYVQITKKEPHFKHDGKYYIAVALAENPQPPSNAVARVMYTITPHIIRHNAQSRPILLLDGETQVGASTHVEHISYFSFYVDAGRINEPVRLEVAMRTGSIRLFASSKTTNPSKINHEYTSEGKSIDMMFKEASFVYVAVYTVSGIESTYDLTYHRV